MKSRYSKIAVFVLLLATIYWLLASPAQATSLRKAPNNLGLVGYWSFNDGMGTTATDFSGNGNHGTLNTFALTGSTSNWVGGKLGTALAFDGSSDYVRSAGFSASTGNKTYTAWIKPNPNGTMQGIIDDTSGWNQVRIESTNKLGVYFDGSTNTASNTTFVAGQWYHIVATLQGTSVKIYVNGVQDGNGTQTGHVTGAGISIGRIEYLASNYFPGSIDEVRIYNRALSASEVLQLYNLGR